ncbi:MAG: DUF5313 domain-containing protein [Nocardiaceae bacterium]|nr:DUF5313 domain-containing protein [Nocardiaceae bacterium]
MTGIKKPNVWQYLRYCMGAVLPPELHEWVRNDLISKGAATRFVVRVTTPVVLVLAPVYLLPTDIVTKLIMTMPLALPFVYFAIALNPVYRRYRLNKHGMDGDLVDQRRREKEAPDMQAYYARYRPEMLEDGANPPT